MAVKTERERYIWWSLTVYSPKLSRTSQTSRNSLNIRHETCTSCLHSSAYTAVYCCCVSRGHWLHARSQASWKLSVLQSDVLNPPASISAALQPNGFRQYLYTQSEIMRYLASKTTYPYSAVKDQQKYLRHSRPKLTGYTAIPQVNCLEWQQLTAQNTVSLIDFRERTHTNLHYWTYWVMSTFIISN